MLTPFLLLAIACVAIAGGAWCLMAGTIALAIGDAWQEIASPRETMRAIVLLLAVGALLFCGGTVLGAGQLA